MESGDNPDAGGEALTLADSLTRQTALLREEMPVRLAGALFAYSLAMLFIDPLVVIAIAAIDLGFEIILWRHFSDPERLARDPWRRRAMLALVFLAEGSFAISPALLWQDPQALVKALSIGILAGSMMNLIAVRSIYLPSGLAGLAAVATAVYGGNAWLWLAQGRVAGLALTSAFASVWVGYCLTALRSNHRLHRDMAAALRTAAEADAAKGRFLAQVSHELRTPLNAILGLSHAELRRATDATATERLSVLAASAGELSTLLDEILDLDAVQSGRLPIRPMRCDPAMEVAGVVALWRPAVEEAGLTLEQWIDPALAEPAWIDRARLRQCLSNLLSNALRHTERGHIAVSAACRSELQGRFLDLIVQDSGPGVPRGRREGLFTASPGTASVPLGANGGHGIGLSITRTIARNMGGNLELDADGAAESGARFRLILPLPPPPASDILRPAPLPPQELASLRGRRILVVDDIATNRLVASACLRLLGAEPVEVASGAAALQIVDREDLDAVLLDMNMPGLDGLETFRALRQQAGSGSRIPVVAMTADALPGQRSRYLGAGLCGYLCKPVTPDRIAESLSKVLDRPAAR